MPNTRMVDPSISDATARQLCDVLDTLIAIRMDIDRITSGAVLDAAEMRLLVNRAIDSTKGLLGSFTCPPPAKWASAAVTLWSRLKSIRWGHRGETAARSCPIRARKSVTQIF
jgi:hypothetical protein